MKNYIDPEFQDEEVVEQYQQWILENKADILNKHYDYIDKRVSCIQVQPFLASQTHPELKIIKDTPITNHIANCKSCRADLETITSLNLEPEQLNRLEALLMSDKISPHSTECQKTCKIIEKVVNLEFDGVAWQALDHLCLCSDCNNNLQRARSTLIEELATTTAQNSDSEDYPEEFCEVTAPFDIYDFVVPFGHNPANDKYSEHRLEYLEHYRNCPECMAKIQQLHETIFRLFFRSQPPIID